MKLTEQRLREIIQEELTSLSESVNVNEASIELDIDDPTSKDLLKLLKKHKVTMKDEGKEGRDGWPLVTLTGNKKDIISVLTDDDGWGDEGEDYIQSIVD